MERHDEADDVFVLRLESWEGPIEALLDLAKSQKVDLANIDILELVSQFHVVVDRALSLRIDLAAEWLVMAAWLTYLKSRLLLRRPKERDKAVPDDDALAFHLRRLNAVRTVAERLDERLRLGRDWFMASGAQEEAVKGGALTRNIHEFLSAYPSPRRAGIEASVDMPPDLKPFDLASVDGALAWLDERLPSEWTPIVDLVPVASGLRLRSNIASTLIAALELTKRNVADVRQAAAGEDVMVREGGRET